MLEKIGGNCRPPPHVTPKFLPLGVPGLADKLKTNIEAGLTPTDFEVREKHFGSNYKAPPKVTPFIELFLGAMDDFMLKFLLVCAIVDLSIEVGFATPDERNTGKFSDPFLI